MTAQQLMTGAVSFVRLTAIDEFVAVAKGAALVCVATLYQGSTFHVISAKDKPINVGGGFQGQDRRHRFSRRLDRAIARNHAARRGDDQGGRRPRKWSATVRARCNTCAKAAIDCFINSIGVVVALQTADEPIVHWPTDRYAPMPSQIYVTTREMIEKKPATVLGFLKALKASTEDMMHGDLKAIFQRANRDFDIPGMKKIDELVALMRFTWPIPGCRKDAKISFATCRRFGQRRMRNYAAPASPRFRMSTRSIPTRSSTRH